MNKQTNEGLRKPLDKIIAHMKSCAEYAEKEGENMDDVSWDMEEGILISYNDAKLILSELLSTQKMGVEGDGWADDLNSEELHPDSVRLLEITFEELRLKMIKSQKKYGYTNGWLTSNWEDECREQLIQHLYKGDPLDVAIYALFMIYRGWSTNPTNPNR